MPDRSSPEASTEDEPSIGWESPDSPGGNGSLIDGAVVQILRRWDELASGWMATRAEASQALTRIADRVQADTTSELEWNGSDESEHHRPLLDNRLVEELRSELMAAWSASPGDHSAEGLLQVLTALEDYRRSIWSNPEDEVTARLAEPDAFELVVELAHDIRSPLNSILFLSEVLRSGHSGPVNDHQRSQLGLVYSATLGMISVVSDVMELAKERRGSADDESGPFSIARVFDSVREMVRPMAEEKGLELRFEVPDYDRYVGHANRIGRVLLNLTTNALKFTERGSVEVCAQAVEPGRVRFSVQDTGRGIKPDDLDKLFHPFRKSEYRAGHFFSGSGLGLSIARRLVRAMSSELEVDTEPGEGTRFYFDLDLPPASSP